MSKNHAYNLLLAVEPTRLEQTRITAVAAESPVVNGQPSYTPVSRLERQADLGRFRRKTENSHRVFGRIPAEGRQSIASKRGTHWANLTRFWLRLLGPLRCSRVRRWETQQTW